MKLLTTFLLSLVITTAAFPGIINVPGDAPTIQAGIDSAAAGDTVLVADGAYFENIDFRGKAIVVASHFAVDGDSSHIAAAVINGSQPASPDTASVVWFVSGEDTASVLSGFTITGGTGTVLPPIDGMSMRGGGGILCMESGAKIINNHIINNTLSDADIAAGGAICALVESGGHTLIVANNRVWNNQLNSHIQSAGAGVTAIIDARISGNDISQNSCNSLGAATGSAIFAGNYQENVGSGWLSNNFISENTAVGNTFGTATVDFTYRQTAVINNDIRNNTVQIAHYTVGTGLNLATATGNSEVTGNRITDNLLLGGYAYGGGIFAQAIEAMAIRGNYISGNSASVGGGIALIESKVTLTKNVIVGNSAGDGGGIWTLMIPSAAANNSAKLSEHQRDALEKYRDLKHAFQLAFPHSNGQFSNSVSGDLQVINNTIADNSAALWGGGLSNVFSGTLVENCIFWNNSAPQDSQLYGEALTNYSDVQGGYPGQRNLDLNPQFDPAGDYHLSPASPAIDAGNPAAAYYDPEDPANPGNALWPAQGALRNDMGAYGGNNQMSVSVDSLLGPRFRAFVARVNSVPTGGKAAIVDSFMAAAPAFPFIDDNEVVYFIYRGNAGQVTVPGDANGWDGNAFPMSLLGGTNLWYREAVFEHDARLDYKFVINGSNWILDPRNPNTVSGGFGPNSELAMPGYVQPWEIVNDPNVPRGIMHDTLFTSTNLNNTRLIRIYTPPSYDATPNDSFGVILFHDGLEYISLGSAVRIFNNLIDAQRIQPVIAVFVPPVDRNNEYAFTKTAQFESFIVDEVMPMVDSKFRTRRDPAYRAMTGPSFGGLITTQICYNNPDVFGLAAPYSPSYWAKNMEVFNSVVNGPVEDVKWYVDWGTYEVGIMLDARVFRDYLQTAGYENTWNEWHEGHSWGSWRAHLDNALEYFFPGPAVGIADAAPLISEFELLQNYPNPFNPETTIRFRLPNAERISLKIYDLLGRNIATLAEGVWQSGEHSLRWNGRNNAGEPVGSGYYFYQLRGEDFSQTRRMLLIR